MDVIDASLQWVLLSTVWFQRQIRKKNRHENLIDSKVVPFFLLYFATGTVGNQRCISSASRMLHMIQQVSCIFPDCGNLNKI